MKRVQVVAARVAALAGLLVAGVGVSAALADPGNGNGPPSSPPGQGECQHGNSGQECKPDPQPEHGKECDDHGNQGGVDEDHCIGTTDSTTTTESTPTNQTTSPSTSTTTDETTTTDQPTTSDETTTTDQPTSTGETTTTAPSTTQRGTTTSVTTTDTQSTTSVTGSGVFTPPDLPPAGHQTTPASPTTESHRHEVLSKQTTKADTSPDSEAKATPGGLPFTGLPIWIVEAFGLLLLAGGLVIRRLAP
jgi:cobalamin biosynthesis Mg chelatase CobN